MKGRQIIVLILFPACYLTLCIGRNHKAIVVWAGAPLFVSPGFIRLFWGVV